MRKILIIWRNFVFLANHKNHLWTIWRFFHNFYHSILTKFSSNSLNILVHKEEEKLSRNSWKCCGYYFFFFNKNWFKKIGNSGARWCKNQNLADKNLWKYYPYYLRKFELLIFKAIISIQIFSIQSGHVHYPTIPIQPLWWTHVWNPNSKKLNWH